MVLEHTLRTGRKPSSAKAARALKERESKVVENPKSVIVYKANKCSERVRQVLHDIHALKAPFSLRFPDRHTTVHPFEDAHMLEKEARSEDASLFVVGSSTKKRPDNLVLGRMHNYELFDMVEFAVEEYSPMSRSSAVMSALGSKPLLVFQGDFDNSTDLRRVRSLLLDFFRGPTVPRINLAGLDHVLVVTALGPDRLVLTHHTTAFKRSGSRLPHVELAHDLGPSLHLRLRRVHHPSAEMERTALATPGVLKRTKDPAKKNLQRDGLGNVRGRVHMVRQDLGAMALRRYKALRVRPAEAEVEAEDSQEPPAKRRRTDE